MNNKMKTFLMCSVAAIIASLAACPRATAGSNNMDPVTAFYNKKANSAIRIGWGATNGGTVNTWNSAASTTTSVMNLSYTGTAASANITVSGGCITFYAPEGTVDTTIGSATCGQTGGTFDMNGASVTTLGQLCDQINGIQGPFALSGNANGGAPSGGNYHCTLTDGYRSDVAAQVVPAVTEAVNVNNLNSVGGYTVPMATDTILSLGIVPAPGKHVELNYCTVNGPNASIGAVIVYGVKAKAGVGASGVGLFGAIESDSTIAWESPAPSANTTTNEPLSTIVPQPWITFGGGGAFNYHQTQGSIGGINVPVGNAYNGHVVVRASNYGTGNAPATSSNFLSCNWNEIDN